MDRTTKICRRQAHAVDWRYVLGLEKTAHPELVRDNPSRFCAADPGHEYLVYLRWGGMVRLDLSASSEHDRFQFRWIDLVDQQVRQQGTAEGGRVRTFHCPEDYPAVTQAKDWVLHVFRVKELRGN